VTASGEDWADRSAPAVARLARARGFSARSSTTQGISPSAAVPNDHH
jgi:hypothetical protein